MLSNSSSERRPHGDSRERRSALDDDFGCRLVGCCLDTMRVGTRKEPISRNRECHCCGAFAVDLNSTERGCNRRVSIAGTLIEYVLDER
jgi:hypothetical protein